ncbi:MULTISPECIES: hypothetical protein [unclassified Pseudomonas]|uniref:hypothetical protein n=1 Tax=unclassified Pseudomonas TaxID=196821 RepID=UPI00387E41AC
MKALQQVLASFVGIITPPLIIASALGLCMGIAAQPTLLSHLPKIIQTLFDSAITSGGITAIVMCILLPERHLPTQANHPVPEVDALKQ